MAEHIETVIIGAGQAGLATGQQLRERGREFVILDGQQRVGDNWRRHYDSLRLYNPAKYCSLPGLALDGDPRRYPTRDEIADYLERYAAHFSLPVRLGTWVTEMREGPHGYLVETDTDTFEAANVVVATGTFGAPYTPGLASDLDPAITQLHSSEYKHPGQLRPGPALVVGAAHSGADIAYELGAEGREVVLAGRHTGEIPFDLESRKMRVIWPILAFAARHVLTLRTPPGRIARGKIRSHGGPLIRYKTTDLENVGVDRVEDRVTGTRHGLPELDGGRVVNATNVIWCTGFQQDFSWIKLPVVGDDGWPREERGVVPEAPGLYFNGLAFQYAFASMLFLGVGRDAAYIADHIDARAPALVA